MIRRLRHTAPDTKVGSGGLAAVPAGEGAVATEGTPVALAVVALVLAVLALGVAVGPHGPRP